jgi:periplasmic divalent cation tolerance protein
VNPLAPPDWLHAPDVGVLSTTVANQAQATQIAHSLVQARLAACVHLHAVNSVYVWEGKVQDDNEWALRIKTTPQCLPPLIAWLRQHHPYDTPELLWQQCDGASLRYGQWLVDQCTGADAHHQA